MSSNWIGNVTDTAISLTRVAGGVSDWIKFGAVAAAVIGLVYAMGDQFATIMTVIGWTAFAIVVTPALWVVATETTWPWDARRIAAWSAAVDTALEAKFEAAWDEAHAERSERDREAAALAAGIDAALADGLAVPDELAARRRAALEAEAG